MRQLITTSLAKAFRACPRLYYHRYHCGIKPISESPALRFGTLLHRGLEAWWRAPEPERLAAAMAAMADEAEPFERAKAEAMMLGYHARWLSEPLDTLAVEVEFRVPLREPSIGLTRGWDLAGKIDAIARDRRTGSVYVVEHKTSGEDISPGSEYWRRLRLDAQLSNYLVGARALGYRPVGCIYDVLAKPALKPLRATPPEARRYRKDGSLDARQRLSDETTDEYRDRILDAMAKSPEQYFARGEVVRLESEEDEAATDMYGTSQAIDFAARTRSYPRNPDACARYGRTCEYFDVCTGVASLDDPTRFKRMENVFPELEQTAKMP